MSSHGEGVSTIVLFTFILSDACFKTKRSSTFHFLSFVKTSVKTSNFAETGNDNLMTYVFLFMLNFESAYNKKHYE